MAGGAAAADGRLRALLRQVRIIVLWRLGRRQYGEIGPEIADVLVAETFHDGLHLLVLAAAGSKEYELPLEVLIRLARERWNILGLRDAVLAVTAGADRDLFRSEERRVGKEC